jgi:peptidoglycan/xylan/chitin deacetylase (PgdA/CDA1 family)
MEVQGENATLEYGTTYEDAGAKAFLKGKIFGNKELSVTVSNPVDTAKVGDYTVTYTAKKWNWEGSSTRTVKIVDTQKPTLTLKGKALMVLTKGSTFEDPGYEATDGYDGALTAAVSGTVDTEKVGEYKLTYTATDSSGNTATAERTVQIKSKKTTVTVLDSNTVLPANRTIYLTFDDGPGPYTAKLLDVLKKYNVKATFFVTDKGEYNILIARMAAEGHAVGIHTASHNYKKIYASEEAFFADQQIVQDIIIAQTGKPTKLMRFPGGSSNTVSRFNPGIMSRLAAAVTEKGMRYFDWNADSNDAGGASTSSEVASNIKNGILSNRYANVLQHDIKGFSVNAVEEVIQWALNKGYSFAALDETSPTCHHGINN